MPTLVWRSDSEEETVEMGRALSRVLSPPVWIGLTGPLGAGKTRFAQGLARGLDYPGRVRSPTFVIENRYSARFPIVHQDLYRLESVEEEIQAGWEENENSVIVVEWADRAEELPARSLLIEIVPRSETGREIRLRWEGDLIGSAEEAALRTAFGSTGKGDG